MGRGEARARETVRPAAVALLAALALGGCAGAPEDGGESAAERAIRANNLGTALLSQQRWDDAISRLQTAIELSPDDAVPRVNLGIALLQKGEVEAARTSFDEGLSLDPGILQGHYGLGLVAKREARFEDAVGHFRVVADADPDDPFASYQLGSALAATGADGEAEAALRRTLSIEPSHVSALYALGRLLVARGETEEGRGLIEESQRVRSETGLSAAAGTQYGEEGLYGLAVEHASRPVSPDSEWQPAWRQTRLLSKGRDRHSLVPSTGAGGQVDFSYVPPKLVAGSGATIIGGMNVGNRFDFGGDFVEASESDEDAHDVVAFAAGDSDGDGDVDLAMAMTTQSSSAAIVEIVIAAGGGELAGDGAIEVAKLQLDRAPDGFDLALVDRDHDGDLDVFFCWTGARAADGGGECRLATQGASNEFAVGDGSGLDLPAAPGGTISVGFSDLDNDRDVDLIVARTDGLHLLSNMRDGTFGRFEPSAGKGALFSGPGGAGRFAVADWNKDGWMDLVVATAKGLRLVANSRRGRFESPTPLAIDDDAGIGSAPTHLVALDADNDGYVDVAAGSAEGPLSVYRNLGDGSFESLSGGMPKQLSGFAPLYAVDADGDGRVDLVGRAPGGLSVLLKNDAESDGRWISVAPRGLRDNESAIGTKVTLLAGSLKQKVEITAPVPVHLGLGERDAVDAVRILWPGGVLQDELELEANANNVVDQLDRKGTSCPIMYAWQGGEWRFVNDFLGGSAIGYQVAPGLFSTPDTDEYVLIEGGLEKREGELSVRFNNQLEEAIYFDEAQLVVVDHPAGTVLHPNERLTPGPPHPEFRLFASDDVRPVARARTFPGGEDVRAALAERDRYDVAGFELLPFKGYAEPHALELDLGEIPEKGRVVLLLDGWIDYADSSSNLAAAQAGVSLSPPELFVPGGPGSEARWIETDLAMGFPAGLPRTMSLDVSDVVNRNDPRLRIETSMRIYWDRARVMVGGEGAELAVSRSSPTRAVLRHGGFPVETSPDGKKPHAYDPSEVETYRSWKAHAGAYTPFGEVTRLVAEADDRFVVTRAGDEMELSFEAPPGPGKGMTRSYLVYARGFGKDMDSNSAASENVAPLPYRGMREYPYAAGEGPERSWPEGARIVTEGLDDAPGAPALELIVEESRVRGKRTRE